MPNISWNDIRQNAFLFSRAWSSATREQADKQTFWNEFFAVFGLPRRTLASFEEPVKRLKGTTGFIDLFWPGKLLVEHKTAGHSLETAESQAFGYIRDLVDSGRQEEAPRYILLSDFRRFALYDLDPEGYDDLPLFHGLRYHRVEFPLAELSRHISSFAFIPGYKIHRFAEQDPANLDAVVLMGNLHDTLKAGGYAGHDLERFLVRVLFCLFAEDTGIFEPSFFELYLENRTQKDGSDLGPRMAQLFETLDTPEDNRQRNLDESLAGLPYVNGELFSERLRFAAFNQDMRNALLSCCRFDWSRISPAIFGALFQEVMTDKERRHIGAHYTSERDILKVIHPLFLDGLRAQFEAARNDRSSRRSSRLAELRERLTQLRFLDPACGCGNFLVIAYRELRALELDLLKEIISTQQTLTLDEVNRLSRIDVNQFYGIEIEEWPARIAEVALWLMDHQCNMRIHEAFGQHFLRLPLRNSPHIHHGNALRMDWNTLLPAKECSYVLGNPPFRGKNLMSAVQSEDMRIVAEEMKGSGVLDYVTAWYFKAAKYIQGTEIEVAFVSTSSISQGQQPGILWAELFKHYSVNIAFAYRSFAWMSEARGRAHLDVIIIGFGQIVRKQKLLFADDGSGGVTARQAVEIGPYLAEGKESVLKPRSRSICEVPRMSWGSMPNDGGNLILSPAEREQLLAAHPQLSMYVRKFVGGHELINGDVRYCLWLENAPPEILGLPPIRERLAAVRDARMSSKRGSTRRLAATPSLFGEIRQPATTYLAVAEVSSEKRVYLPIAFLSRSVIASNKIQTVANAKLFHFAVLASAMHAAWVQRVAGRLESRLDYSATLVYNNYPWPTNPTPTQQAAVKRLAQSVLDARAQFPNSTLAELYDPLLMPPKLLKAHQKLDRAVELCYRPEPFANDQARVEFLFSLYEQLTAPLLPKIAHPRRRAASR